MIKQLIIIGLLLGLPLFALAATATPDPAPPLEWDTHPTHSCADSEIADAVTTDSQANAYLLSTCAVTGANRDLILTKISSTGTVLWEKTANCDVLACVPYGMATSNDGYVAVAWYSEAETNSIKQKVYMFRQSDGTVKCDTGYQGVTFPNGITNDIGQPFLAANAVTSYKLPDGTTAYAIGGQAGMMSIRHSTPTTCGQLWTTGNGGGAGTAYNKKTNLLAVGSGTSATLLTDNATTGTNVGANGGIGLGWGYFFQRNTTGRSLWSSSHGQATVTMKEFNSTTAALIRTVTPYEDYVLNPTYGMSGASQWVDGANSMFVCGWYYNAPIAETRPAIAKYNTTQLAGQRWNVTWGDAGAVTATERVSDCEIAVGGALYASWRYDGATGDEVHVRKYTNAGVANERDADYVLPGDSITTTTPDVRGSTDAAAGFKGFCDILGASSGTKFLCGLVIVASGTILVGAIASQLTDRKGTTIAAGSTGMALMVFVAIPPLNLWPGGIVAIFVVLCAGIITWAMKNQFIQKGG